jgi:hypothetical protein
VKIHRSQPEARFTIIPDETLRDPQLSYAARGVLAEILSRPDDWATTADAIWARARRERGKKGEGRDVVRAAFAELETAGYLHRGRRRGARGRFVTDVHVFDAPDGLEAWQACEAFRAGIVVDNSPPGDVSAGRTDDDTGSRRSDLGKHASSQVAPTTDLPAAGPPGAGPPGAGQSGVFTETYDGDLNTKTVNENVVSNGNDKGVLTSPVPVEGLIRTPGQDHQRDDNDERNRQLDALQAWMRDHPQAAP